MLLNSVGGVVDTCGYSLFPLLPWRLRESPKGAVPDLLGGVGNLPVGAGPL